jgi:hypothetical protein
MCLSLETTALLIATNTHFVVGGPPDSGKTAFLRALLLDCDAFTAVHLASSHHLTDQLLIDIFRELTNLISRLRTPRRFAFLFDNVARPNDRVHPDAGLAQESPIFLTRQPDALRVFCCSVRFPCDRHNSQLWWTAAALPRALRS